jgi:hypothetical protein
MAAHQREKRDDRPGQNARWRGIRLEDEPGEEDAHRKHGKARESETSIGRVEPGERRAAVRQPRGVLFRCGTHGPW